MAIRVAGAQMNLTVGDIGGNEAKIAASMDQAAEAGADVLLLPELAIPGYPPEDLVLRRDFVAANIEALHRLADRSSRMTTIVGFVDFATGQGSGAADAEPRLVANAAGVLSDGELRGVYHKVLLPNYGVFDEDRYFVTGSDPARIWEIGGVPVGVSVCEDIWRPDGPPSQQAANGARVLLNINASPFHRGKAEEREEMLAARARAGGAPVVYLNLVGGQDELVFDGASAVIAPDGRLLHRSPQFEEDFFVVDVPEGYEEAAVGSIAALLDPTEEIYRALTTGLSDYCRKNGFEGVVIQLSGGIDSALTATIAADALGPGSVWAIGMPTRFSSRHSVEDARALAENLGIRFDLVPIDDVFGSHLDTLSEVYGETGFGVAEENIQARIRGTIAMAISNKFGPMVLATGNKSEMAVGYATLYGDMVGGYSVLKDVFKGVVYELASWRNKDGEVIPQNTIDKPPSAELRPNQRDSDSLPPYDVLDPILERYIENDMGVQEIIADGYDPDTVIEVARLVDRSEYKRRQSAPGVKITTKAFGKDRRLPITNHYRPIAP
ncbi:MAG TPA: NAD+ synthase [Acidimicrobiia bacterium]|nr:NAD+ synthase [Acidimicrobiia bacterium]